MGNMTASTKILNIRNYLKYLKIEISIYLHDVWVDANEENR